MKKNLFKNILHILTEAEYIDIIKNLFRDRGDSENFPRIMDKLILLFDKQNNIIMKNVPSSSLNTPEGKESSIQFLGILRGYIKEGELYKVNSIDNSKKVQELINLRKWKVNPSDTFDTNVSEEDKIRAANFVFNSKYSTIRDDRYSNLNLNQVRLVKDYEKELLDFYKLGRLNTDFADLKNLAQTLHNDFHIPKEKIDLFLIELLNRTEYTIETKGKIEIRTTDFIDAFTLFRTEIINNAQLQKIDTKLDDIIAAKSEVPMIQPSTPPATRYLLPPTPELNYPLSTVHSTTSTATITDPEISSKLDKLSSAVDNLKSQIKPPPVPKEYEGVFGEISNFLTKYSWGIIVVFIIALIVTFFSFMRKTNAMSVSINALRHEKFKK